MREVAILGAGDLGGAVAHAVARLDVARWIRLIDERGTAAHGKALDISQAAPVEGFSTRLAGASDAGYAAAADVVVVADRFGAGEWPVEDAAALLRRIGRASAAPIVCAGASAAALVDRAARELGIARERVIGTAPEALASAARALVALAVDGSPADVGLTILGLPPANTVVTWSAATAGGQSLTAVLDEPSRRMLDDRIARAWPPGPLALAAAAAKAIACIDGRLRQQMSAFVAPDDTAGARTRVAALPVRIGPGGVAGVVMPPLTAGEQVALDNALLV